ncbi:hypothetical protein QTP88_005598 [Uroleucon formosanum]
MGSCGMLLLALIFTFATKVLCEDDTTMGPMFIKEPENRVDFSNTTGAIVECTARGSPRPEIIWIRADGTAVGDVPGLRQVKGDGNLVFPPFRAEDYKQEVHAQVYICMAKNRVGVIHSRDVNVRAVVNQNYESELMPTEYVIRGNSAILKCSVPSFVADFITVESWVTSEGQTFTRDSSENTIIFWLSCKSVNYFTVVIQNYVTEAENEYVIRGNTAIVKCKIPSFVADFVSVDAWIADSDTTFTAHTLFNTNNNDFVHQSYEVEADNEYVIRGNSVIMKCEIPSFVADFVSVTHWVDSTGNSYYHDNDDVVNQLYQTRVIDEYVLLGNSVVLKCLVPSFVADFIHVLGWVDDTGNNIGSNVDKPVVSQYYEAQVYDMFVIRGNTAIFKCFVPSFVSDYVYVDSWEATNGETYFTPNTDYAVNQYYEAILYDMFVIKGNTAIFKCIVPSFVADYVSVVSWEDTVGNKYFVSSDKSFVVNQLYTVNVMDESVLRGNTAILKCHIPSFVADYVFVSSWTSDDGDEYTINANHAYDGKYLVLPSGELHIRDVTPEDGTKSYQCRTKHRLTGETRLSATKGRLVITDPQTSISPKIKKEELAILIGKPFMIESLISMVCSAQGFPVPYFRWYKFIEGSNKKQAVTLDDRIKQVSGTLIIREAKVDDSGKYLCVVNNSVGGESVETVLTVTAPLNAIVEPTIQTVDFGRPATLTCNYEGNPVKTISWLKDGKRLSSHDGRVLRIDSVRKEDKGMYQCFVRNEQESAQGSAELKLGGRFEPPHIKEYFNDNTMQPGVSLHLKCIASGNPTPEINWELDSKRLSSTERLRIGQHITMAGEVVSYLNISSVHTNDGGHYRCVAVSKVGAAEHTAHLNVYGLPFIRPMDKKNIVSGENLFVTCPVAGYPLESITWERDNRQLPINRKQKVFPNGTLIIENVERSSDQATYTCVARNAQGHTAKGNLEVQVMVPPVILPFAFDGETNAGDNAQLTCHVSKGDMPLELFWTFLDGNNRSVPLPELTTINRIGKKIAVLEIPVVTQFHRGTYVCTANNRADRVSQFAVLSVNVPPLMKPFSFEGESNVGDTAQLTCHVIKGDTPLEITWVFQGPDGHIQPMPHPIIENRIGKKITMLEIPTVTEYHRGSYSCIAKNRAGIINQTALLMVNVPPSIMPFSVDGELSVGDNAQLTCHVARGDMPINISWTFQSADGGTVGSLPEPILLNRIGKKIFMLEIPSVTEYHRGSYTCIATNRAGVIEHTAKLMVNVLPRIRPFEFESAVFAGEPVQITCFVTKGDKPLRISWYLHSKELTSQTGITTSTMGDRTSSLSIASASLSNAGNYTCVAQNAVGMDYYSAYLEVNVPPRIRPFEFESAVYAGEPVQLTCLVTKGDKPLRISWYLQSKELTVPQTGIITNNLSDRANSLSIFSAGISNRGNYTCIAQNAVGMDSYSAYLKVNVPPRISPFAFESAVFAGEPVQITCLVTKGDKPLRISWYFHTTELTSSQTGVYTSSMGDRSNILSIPSAGLPNGGNYTCVAQNAVGMDYYSAYLEVNVRPQILPFSFGDSPSNAGDKVQVGCTVAKGDQPLRINWNFYGEELSSNMGVSTMAVGDSMNVLFIPSVAPSNRGNYTCVAKNFAGYDSYTSQLLVNVRPKILPFSFGDTPSNAGNTVQVACTVSEGDKPLRISWNFYGEELSSNMGVSTMPVGESMNALFISSVAPSNRGNYTCVAQNSAGLDSFTAQLLVNVRPKILPFSFGDLPSNAGNPVQVGCTVMEGDKPLRITWNFYGEELSSNMGVSTMPVGDSMNVLIISSVVPSNRGNYTCLAKNSAGNDSFTAQLLVNVLPKIVPFSFGNGPVNSGESIQVVCSVSKGDRPMSITWSFYGEALSSDMGVTTQMLGDATNFLSIPSAGPSNQGNYTCIAKNNAGLDTYTSQLVVYVLPKILPFSFGDGPVNAGESVQLSCSVAKGDKPMSITWSFYGEELSSHMGVTTQMFGDTTNFLSIPSVSGSNRGNYTCIAKNSVGLDSFTSQLMVNVLPHIVPFSVDEKVRSGDSIQLNCHVSKGDKPLELNWLFNDDELSSELSVTTTKLGSSSSVLTIGTVSAAHTGKYTCIASNRIGSYNYSTYINVDVPPKMTPFTFGDDIPEADETISIQCTVSSGDIPIEFAWTFNGKSTSDLANVFVSKTGRRVSSLTVESLTEKNVGNYTCLARNMAGETGHTASLYVNVFPKIKPFTFGDTPVFAGQSAQVACSVSEGDSPLEMSWTFDGPRDVFGLGVSVLNIGTKTSLLSIDYTDSVHRGNYTCRVTNRAGRASYTAGLNVHVPPRIVPFAFDEPIYSGQSAQITCLVSEGDAPLNISWWFRKSDESELRPLPSGISVNKMGSKLSMLFIESTSSYFAGNYACVVENRAGSSKHTSALNVHVAPRIEPFSFGDPVYDGQSTQVTCFVSEGDPPLDLFWTFSGRAGPAASPLRGGVSVNKMGSKVSMLYIDAASSSRHAGNYTCVATNRAGRADRTATLNVHVKPEVEPFSITDSTLNEGGSTKILCSASSGDTPMHFSWTVDGRRLADAANGDRLKVQRLDELTSLLSLTRASPENAGNYSCVARNEAGSASRTATLKVMVPPRWILEPTDKAFAQGGDAKIECKADGFPKPQVTWKKAIGNSPGDYKDIKDLKPGSDDIKVDEGTLSIHNIQKNHEGHYLCEAVNGIGSGLSAVITISVQAPPHFEIKARNQTSEKGQPAVLECMAKGEKPIGIVWNMNNKRLDAKEEERYTIREEILTDGVKSDLSIKRSERIDTAVFTCVATNSFGSDDSSIQLIVQEVPEIPFGLKVLDKSGRTVQLSWLAPYDGNSPITRYVVEYKLLKNTWETDIEKVEATGDKTEMSVVSLHPATTYHFRIVAENGVGLSKPSDPVTIITSEEAPGGKPTNIHVDPIDENTLKVMWKAPERSDWNGEIQGYYVGYKQSSLVENKFVFETVEFSKEEGKEHYLEIFNLKTYTQYTIVVQAFNKLGAGPMSDEIKQYTSEGVPEQPPHDTTCTTLTSQTIRISWVSPPLNTANGVIKGYKVIYGPSDSWFNESTKDTKITVSSETILHGLKKFTNYSMEVLAFTAGGDGVRAPRIYCQTEQDVPEAPAALKALVMSTESVLVSWKPPAEPNGDVNQYTVYIKPSGDNKDKEPLVHKVAPNQMSFEASGLIKQDPYEFWVTASTNIGEGQPTKSIVIAPSTRVPAMIASFDDSFVATYREDVKLPCLTVGVPAPEISWKVKGAPLESNDRIRQLPEGSLLIRSVTRTDAGEYSCFVENSFGKDKITHHIVVLAPPHKPEVSVGATTSNTITLNLKPHAADKEPIHGYTIKYKPEFGDWQTAQVAAKAEKFTLENLWCGSRYQIAVTAYNLIGTGDESDLLNTKTTGSKPKIPEASKFIEVSATSVTLHLNAWLDGGCPMLYFVVEHKKKLQSEWTQVSNNVRPGGNFVVLDLDPASWYHLRVTAHNNAGFSVAEYEFASLTLSGGTIAPPAQDVTSIYTYLPWIPKWIDLNVVVPTAATIIVIIVGIIVVCFAWSRRVHENGQTRLRDDMTVYNQSMIMGGNTLDKRHTDFNDELGYIAPPNRKLPPVPGSNYNTCDRIKRGIDGEDICPYATFHLLGFREEMDPSKMPFQTFPHPNGHCGTIGPGGTVASNGLMHQCPGTQTMPRNGRYSRVGGANSMFSPEYDDPANMGDEYGSQYGQYGAPYEQYESRASMAGRSIGSPEPPPPPPRNHDPNVSNTSNEANDSKDSNQISEAECDQHQQPATQNYGETKPQQDNNASKTEGSQPTILWQCNL